MPGNEVAPQAVMGLFGGTQIETNKRNLVRIVIAWIGFNRTTDTCSNKIEVIVLDDQKSREFRRIRTTGLAVYSHDCTILEIYTRMRTWRNEEQIAEK